MAFQTDLENVPTLRSYEDAKRRFEHADRWRGKTERILSRRTQKQLSIRELHDGSIACRLYNTDVVVYRPNGDIVVDLSYDSKTTREFASNLIGRTISRNRHGVIYVTLRIADGGGHYRYEDTAVPTTFTLHREINPEWPYTEKLEQAASLETFVLNKARAAEIRKELQPVLERVKLVANNMTHRSLRTAFWRYGYRMAIRQCESEDDYYDTAMRFVAASSANTHRIGLDDPVEESTAVKNGLRSFLDTVYDVRGALDAVPVDPAGWSAKSRYATLTV